MFNSTITVNDVVMDSISTSKILKPDFLENDKNF